VTLLVSRIREVPTAADAGAWYFPGTVFLLASIAALAIWGFRTALGSRRLWKDDLFG
jgi:hypothetical protein